MEEDPSRQQAASIRDDIAALSSTDEEFAAQELNYGQVSSAEDDEYEHQEWAGAASEKCNLIVNYLPHEIDDVTLKTLFVEHGDIAVAKVVKDKISKKSLGYGFVKFLREEDAASAIESKNGFLMGHKKLKVSLARPPSTEIRNCKLYITNLPKEFTEKEVSELFSQFGEIIECRVLKDRNSKSNKGVAFVQFSLRVQANNALSLNGYRPPHCDRHLMVKYAEDQNKKKDRRAQVLGGMQGMNMMDNMGMMEGLKQDHRDPYYFTRSRAPSNPYRGQQTSPMPMQSTHMPMNNLNQNYQSSPPQSYPSSRGSKNAGSGLSSPQGTGGLDWYGQMSPMVYDNHMNSSHTQLHNQSMGYSTHHGIQPMMSEGPSNQRQNYNLIQGGQYQYSRGPSDGGRPQDNSVTLLIGYLPQHADVALLHDLCSPYGRILSAQIDIDNSNPSDESCSGRGRVQMAELSQAQYATQALNGAIIFEGGRPLQVNVALNGTSRSMSNQKKLGSNTR